MLSSRRCAPIDENADYTFRRKASKQASIFICHSVKTHNNAKIYIKQADRLPERPKAINAGCPKLTDNTTNAMKTKKERKKKRKKRNTYK